MKAFDALAPMRSRDIGRIADLLDADLLAPPFTPLALLAHVSDARAGPLAECLAELAGRKLSQADIALLLRAFAAGRRSAAGTGAAAEVVVSGPDGTGSARDTGVVMRQLFSNARQRVLAVGFAVHQGKSVFRKLAKRLDERPALDAVLCLDVRRPHGDTSLDEQIVRRFAVGFQRDEWPGSRLPLVYYDPRSLKPSGATTSALHAKCVVVDGRKALVTSANFTEAAQRRNVELGLLVSSQGVARRIEAHFTSLIRKKHLERLTMP